MHFNHMMMWIAGTPVSGSCKLRSGICREMSNIT